MMRYDEAHATFSKPLHLEVSIGVWHRYGLNSEGPDPHLKVVTNLHVTLCSRLFGAN